MLIIILYLVTTVASIVNTILVLTKASFKGKTPQSLATWSSIAVTSLTVLTPIIFLGTSSDILLSVLVLTQAALLIMSWRWGSIHRKSVASSTSNFTGAGQPARTSGFIIAAWVLSFIGPIWVCFSRSIFGVEAGWGAIIAAILALPFIVVMVAQATVLQVNKRVMEVKEHASLLKLSLIVQWSSMFMLAFLIPDFGDSSKMPSILGGWVYENIGSTIYVDTLLTLTVVLSLIVSWIFILINTISVSRKLRKQAAATELQTPYAHQ